VNDEPILLDISHVGETVVVSLSNGERYELATASLPAAMPRVGGRLTSPLLAEIESAAQRKLAARAVFRMLDRRLHAMATLREKLLAKGFGSEIVEAVLTQLTAKGIHSDRRFAEAFCRDTLRRGPRGRQYLLAKLWEKGVRGDDADAVLEQELPRSREAALARRAARTRWERHRGDVDERAISRVIRFLAGRGFPAGLASSVARQTAPDRESADEEDTT